MIVDTIENAARYSFLGERFKKAFEILATMDFSNKEVGRYEIEGRDMFYMVQEYETRSLEDAAAETHTVYADIQYIVSGTEKIGFGLLKDLKETVPYSSEKDIAKYQGPVDFTRFESGMFAVYFPEEPHEPCVMTEKKEAVKKVVFKIKMNG